MKIFHERTGIAKGKGLAAIVIAVALMVAAMAHAETVTVFTEPLAPVHFEQDDEIIGVATEVVRAIFEEAGMEPRIEIYPWKRAYLKVLNTPGSFIYTINRTEKREQLFKWIGPILAKDVYLYKLKGREDITLNTIEDAKKYTTAVILGHSLTSMFQDRGFREGRELIITPNKDVQMNLFLKGRCDLITGNEYTIYQSLKTEGYLLEHVEPALFIPSGDYYLGANINVGDEVIQELQKANARVQQSGVVEEIIDKYIK